MDLPQEEKLMIPLCLGFQDCVLVCMNAHELRSGSEYGEGFYKKKYFQQEHLHSFVVNWRHSSISFIRGTVHTVANLWFCEKE